VTDNEIKIRITTEANKATAEIKKLNRDIDKLNRKSADSGKSAKNVDQLTRSFKQLAIHVGKLMVIYGSAKGLISAISLLKDMESSLADVSKTTNLAGDELDDFDAQLQEMSKELKGVKYTELLEIAAAAGQLGVTGSENLLAFTEAVAKVAIATEYTADEAGVAFGRLANATKTPVTEIENLASSVNELSNTTAATVSEIVNVSQKMAGTATTFGLTAGEIAGVSATLKALGVTTEVAGSAFKKILGRMLVDTESFAHYAGVPFEEFATLVEEKPTEAILLFLESLKGLSKTEVANVLSDMSLKGLEVSDVVLKLAGDTETLKENMERGNKAFEDNISIQDEYLIRSRTFQASMDSFNSSIEVLIKSIGIDMLEALSKGTDELTEMINTADPKTLEAFSRALGALTEAVMNMVIGLAAGIGAVTKFTAEHEALVKTVLEVGILVGVLYKYRKALILVYGAAMTANIASFAAGIKKATAALKLMALASPFAALAFGIGLLLYKYNEMVVYTERLTAATDRFNDVMKTSQFALEGATLTMANYRGGIKQTEAQRESLILKIGEELQALSNEIDRLKNLDEQTEATDMLLYQLEQRYGALTEAVDLLLTQDLAKDLGKEAEAAKKSEQAQKELAAAVRGTTEAMNEKIHEQSQMLAELYAAEKEYVNRVTELKKEAFDIERKYANMRLDLEDRHLQVMYEANNKGLNAYQQYQNQRARVDELIRKGREAAEGGNIEQAEKYYAEALSLAEGFAGETIKVDDRVKVSKEQTLAEYQAKYLQIHRGQLQAIHAKEQAEIAANLAEMKMAQAELELTRAQIKAQIALIQVIEQKKKAITSDAKIDLTGLKQSLAEIDKLIESSKASQEGLEVEARMKKAQLEADLLAIDTKIQKVANDPKEVVVRVSADTTPASNDHAAWLKWAADKKAQTQLEVDTANAKKQVDTAVTEMEADNPEQELEVATAPAVAEVNTFVQDTNKVKPVTQELYVDMNPAYIGVTEFTNFVSSQQPYITVDADTSPAYQALNELVRWANSLVTSHIHYIYAQRVGFNTGGQVPGFVNGGGFFKKSGKIPGHDLTGSDDVKAMLTRGEFVQPVRSVDYYGAGVMEALRSMSIPKDFFASISTLHAGGGVGGSNEMIPHFSSGGSVAAGSELQPINLNFGGKTFQVMSDREVADALQRFIETEGGY